MKKPLKVCFIFAFMLFFLNFQLKAEKSLSLFPDDSSIRKSLIPLIFEKDLSISTNFEKRLFTDSSGQNWRLWVEKENQNVKFYLSPGLNGVFSASSQGTWILSRDITTGEPTKLQIILRSHYPCFLEILPNGNQSTISLIIQNAYFSQNSTIAVPLKRFYELSFLQIKTTTDPLINWTYADPDPVLYQNNRRVIKKINENLKAITYGDEGCYDETNQLVSIKTGKPDNKIKGINCSGFVKWIVDSMVWPVIGQGLFVEPLKSQTVTFNDDDLKEGATAQASAESYSRDYTAIREPFFGLDWTRNLAAAAASVFCNRNLTPLTAGVDVMNIPFSSIYDKSSLPQLVPSYIPNMGFSVSILKPLLYALAISEPDTLYLASINGLKSDKNGEKPLRQHYHTAVLVPAILADGSFTVAIFESGESTTLEKFINRNKTEYIHLTRIRTPGQIYFPSLQ